MSRARYFSWIFFPRRRHEETLSWVAASPFCAFFRAFSFSFAHCGGAHRRADHNQSFITASAFRSNVCRLMINKFRSAWSWRAFILSSILTEQRVRFAGSKLGAFWMLLGPLLEVLVYALILSSLMLSRVPGISGPFGYAIYLTAGTVAWSLFSEIVTRCLSVFTSNAHLLKKIAFPAMCLPMIISGSAVLANLFLLAAVLLIF
jgi:hypothetical protein